MTTEFTRKLRATRARRKDMTPEEIIEDKRRLNRELGRKWRSDNPKKAKACTDASFKATGGIHHPGRIKSRKATTKVDGLKDKLIRLFIGETKYKELLAEAWRLYKDNGNEIPEDFKKGRFRSAAGTGPPFREDGTGAEGPGVGA